jgi:glycerophosphoryl diester phosphodiesterase
VAPRPSHPYLDTPHPIAFAHRGGVGEHPENTLPAFEHAVDLGFRYLETDVHATADGVLVAFHDEHLGRTCGIDAEIGDLSWSELSEVRVEGEAPIPRLGDLLMQFPEARFNIDAKADGAIEELVAVIQRTESLDRVCLASFSSRRLRKLRKLLGPGLLTNVGPVGIVVLSVFGRLPGSHPQAAQVPPSQGWYTVVDERFVRNAHRAGIPVHVWTIDEPGEMHRLLDLGVDGIMTDQPEALRDVYEERGIWQG